MIGATWRNGVAGMDIHWAWKKWGLDSKCLSLMLVHSVCLERMSSCCPFYHLKFLDKSFYLKTLYKFLDTVAQQQFLKISVEWLPVWALRVPDWGRKWFMWNYFKKINGRKGLLCLQKTITIISQHSYGMLTNNLLLFRASVPSTSLLQFVCSQPSASCLPSITKEKG